MRQAPDLQHFFVEMFPFARLHGECSLLAATAPMYPAHAQRLFEFGNSGRVHELFCLQRELSDVDAAILAPAMGAPLMDGAWDKLRVRLGLLPDFPLRLLSPYATFPDAVYEACRVEASRYSDWLR
jgi:hypothetical protein